MFPILPSTGLHAEADRNKPAPANDHEYAQKHGRIVHFSSASPDRHMHLHETAGAVQVASGEDRVHRRHESPMQATPSRARLILVAALVIITLAVLVVFL